MPVVFDLETKNSFQEVGGHYPERLQMSVAVTYDTADATFHRYSEADASQLALDFVAAAEAGNGPIVGYNLLGFDYLVLQQYTDEVALMDLPTLDMMVELQKRLGFRPRLDSVATATLQVGKSADGLQAVRWWREGRIEEIFDYCQQDVDVTYKVYEFGRKYRYVQYFDRQYRVQRVPVAW